MRTTVYSLLTTIALVGCGGLANTDYDNDGVTADIDCDDFNESIRGPQTYFVDADGDGWGLDGTTEESCERPVGFAARVGDCNDDDPGVSPGAEESCNG